MNGNENELQPEHNSTNSVREYAQRYQRNAERARLRAHERRRNETEEDRARRRASQAERARQRRAAERQRSNPEVHPEVQPSLHMRSNVSILETSIQHAEVVNQHDVERQEVQGSDVRELAQTDDVHRVSDAIRAQNARQSESEQARVQRRERERQRARDRTRLFNFDSLQYLDISEMSVQCQHCGAMHWSAERIVSSTEQSPQYSNCCQKGKYSLPLLSDPPALLRELLTGSATRDRRFRQNIRKYNSALSMAAVTASWVNRGPGSSAFNPTITLQGQIYHYIGALIPAANLRPAFLSVYIFDSDYGAQASQRATSVRELDVHLMQQLTEMLHQVNPYVQTFTSLREWAQEDHAPTPYQMVIHADRRPTSEHARRYNGPTCSEVAAIVPGSEDGECGRRDIVLRRRGELNANGNEVLDTISVSHRSCDPLCYVLLFPDGRDGWYPELKINEDSAARRNKITPTMFYSWYLFQRENEFSCLLRSCRLMQQYVVDQFCKAEAEKLSYLREHQAQLRASDYTRLRELLGDSGRMEDEASVVRAGRLFILPSTHVGGERYMRQQMHDIIAISNKIGHPDFFLTITCNPNWPEIRRALLPGQIPQDRPDLAVRVFMIKLRAMMSYIIDEKLFGTVAAHVRVVEFQKRGLPHAHCIFFLDRASKQRLKRPENVDELICAEIPSVQDQELRDLVLKHSIHTPCDPRENSSAVCLKEGICQKYFPKQFINETCSVEGNYYVTYKRRSPAAGGEQADRTTRIGSVTRTLHVDNSWVVPYNPKLTRMFACHLNVELCISRVGGIKYLFKYVCKGHDRVTVELIGDSGNQRYDEIRHFQDARYVSASEALWRLYGFDIVDRSPPVVRLDVHLENHHTLYYAEGQETQAAARRRAGTKLTEWFEANKTHADARHLRYVDFPQYFTWNKGTKVWTPRASMRVRQARNDIGSGGSEQQYDFTRAGAHVVSRMYTVSPREGERFYLRTLLLHVKGATSFAEIRNVNNVQCNSFRDACKLRGLLADDAEWRRVLDDAFRSSFVPLTHVFATILANCEPCSPRDLWNGHRDMFITDIRNRFRRYQELLSNESIALAYALIEVKDYLSDMVNAEFSTFGLPAVREDLAPLAFGSQQEIDLNSLRDEVHTSISSFNTEQRQVFNEIVGAILPGVTSSTAIDTIPSTFVASNQPQLQLHHTPPSLHTSNPNPSPSPPHSNSSYPSRLFLLDAPGGTGKTFVTKAIHGFLQLRNKNVIAVATSAVAAQLLRGGRTAHSTFKIPIPCTESDSCNVPAESQLATKLRNVDLIIWDEIVMCQRYCIDAVDRTMRDLTRNRRPFGGKVVLFSGDFRQILPVIEGGSRAQIVHACVKTSPLYRQFRTLRLSENMRLTALRNDPNADADALSFPDFLLALGEGRVSCDENERITLPSSIALKSDVRTFCRAIFTGIESNYMLDDWLTKRAILTTKNAELEEINAIVGAYIPGEMRTFTSADTVENENENALRYPIEMLNTLNHGSALPDHTLSLKKGFIVMLLRNLDPKNGHVNGTRYVVEDMTNNVLFLRVATGMRKGAKLTLPRISCGPGDDSFPVPGFKRLQFPIRVCFAITTNKAQGQSFGEKLGIDLREDCFSHGQLYVALSRATHPSNIVVLSEREDRKTKNIVYPEVLSTN